MLINHKNYGKNGIVRIGQDLKILSRKWFATFVYSYGSVSLYCNASVRLRSLSVCCLARHAMLCSMIARGNLVLD